MSQTGIILADLLPAEALADAYKRALDTHSIVSIGDTARIIRHVNDQFCALLGYSRDELIGQSYDMLVGGQQDRNYFAAVADTVNSGRIWCGEICNRTKDGQLLWFDNIIIPLMGADSQVEGHLSVRRDITRRKSSEQKLRHSEQFLSDVADIAKVGGWSLDLASGELFWSDQTKRIHDVAPDYVPTLDAAIDFYAPEARSTITHAVESSMAGAGRWDVELPLITAKGRSIWVRAVGHSVFEDGKATSVIGAFQDITERRLVEDVLREEVTNRHTAEQLLRDVLETLPDAVAAFDEDDRLLVCNSSYIKTYAASADVIVPGVRFEEILRFGLARGQYGDVGRDPGEQEAWLAARMAAHRDPPERLNQKLRDGTWLQVREHRSPNGTTVGVRSDVTALKRAEMELRRFAEEDPLTGLLNRARFFHKLDDLLERTFAGQSGVSAVALFDLDHFKPINDTYGHVVGDEVLIEVARRLRLNLESDDFAARLGGDEFVFVMANRADQQACEDDIETLFAALGQAFQTSGPDLEVSLSLGTVFFRDASQPSRHLLKLADLAQYRAKHDGRGRWYRFDESDWRKLDAEASMGEALSADLERYGARKLGAGDDAGGPSPLRFGLMPFADAQSGRPHGFSAEMAWQHEGLLLQGAELRHIAQKANESGRLCEHKLASLLGEVASLEERGIACGRIWITLGAEQLRLARFAEKFNQMRAGFDIAPDRLLLAVEERAFSERSASAIEASLKELRALGMALGVDQFGSGASRLGLLQSLGVEAVRLAPELCAAALQSSSDEQLVRGLVAMVQPLGMDVVASAVANPRQAALLATLGCTSFQGPLISAPLEAEEIVLFLGKAANQQLAQLAEQISTDKPIGARADAA